MDLGLQGRVAMITGGSRGLGRRISEALGREGCALSICARDAGQLATAVNELSAQGYKVRGTPADVTDEGDARRFYEETVAEIGDPDILVNNVGGRRGSVLFEETSMEQFREGLEVNLFSAVELTAMALPHMKEQGWGRIISISSIYGREHGGSIDYMTGKAALIAFSKHLALQMAPHGVLVNCVAPGSIDFPGSTWDRFQNTQTPEVVAEFIDRNLPMGRFGWPQPIAETVAFLASDCADLITGACINVDGGQSKSLF
ncbi:MAG: SDR family NAD(P)-dependent oxidoreductase [Chloroflexi bacterium]|nr:SDR family NAD(P)-dependent oxidoreductase [Chloroflexota bacterium]